LSQRIIQITKILLETLFEMKSSIKSQTTLKRGHKKAQPIFQTPETLFAVLPLLCHKTHLNYKHIKKIFSSKLRLNLAWHSTGARISLDFSWFVKLHTG